jgi:alkanesulfonate monooxygenase SsuD/methylene tetrahydromethanopterin reductase-like flavin-dependent oxidoreductase (luciferase family)
VQHKLWGSSYVAAVSDWAAEVIRRMLAESHVTFDGELFKYSGLSSTAKRVGKLPIYIGGMSGPLTFRLAGEIGDGILLSYGYSREYFKYVLDEVEKGAKKFEEFKRVTKSIPLGPSVA